MESGVEYRFPVFEGKFSKFNNFPVKRCQRIPLNPDNDHVYIVYTTDKESLHQDGFKWSAGNKSNKEFFKNISNVQRAIKYKCSIFGCPAVKFVDTVLSHAISRIYYDFHHLHDDVAPASKKRKSHVKSIDKGSKVKKRKFFIDESYEEQEPDDQPDDFKRRPCSNSTNYYRIKEISEDTSNNSEESNNPRLGEEMVDINCNKGSGDEVPLVASELSKNTCERNDLVNDIANLELKSKLNEVQIKLLRKKKNALSQNLLDQLSTIQRLRVENSVLQKSIEISNREVGNLQSVNDSLQSRCEENGINKKFKGISQEISVLESLIEQRIGSSGNYTDEVCDLQQSLNIFSGRKQPNSPAVSTPRRNHVSRSLFGDIDGTEAESDFATNLPARSTSLETCQTDVPLELHEEVDTGDAVGELPAALPVSSTRLSSLNLIKPNPNSNNSNCESVPREKLLYDSQKRAVCSRLESCQTELGSSSQKEVAAAGEAVVEDPSADFSVNYTCFEQSSSLNHPPINPNSSSGICVNVDSDKLPHNDPKEAVGAVMGLSTHNSSGTKKNSRHSVSANQHVANYKEGAGIIIDHNDEGEESYLKCGVNVFLRDEFYNSQESTKVQDNLEGPEILNSSVTFLEKGGEPNGSSGVKSPADRSDVCTQSTITSFKLTEAFWNDAPIIQGCIPHGQNGKGVFRMEIDDHRKSADISDLDDGRDWSKKKVSVKSFDGCSNRRQYYQDCNGYKVCPNKKCTARKLFGKPSRIYVKKVDKITQSVKFNCSSCDSSMEHKVCLDLTMRDKNDFSPKARRYLDFDYCHGTLSVKYVGTHSCLPTSKVRPMDDELIKQYYLENPGSTAARFRDYVIKRALHNGEDVNEVSLQYADINKIRQVMLKWKKSFNPDGTGIGYIRKLAQSFTTTIGDKYLLSTFEEPKMIIVSSSERLKVAALLTKEDSTTESASIDFCESQIKDHSVMEVTTYSGELRQVFPNIFSINKVSSKMTKIMMYLVVVYDFHFNNTMTFAKLSGSSNSSFCWELRGLISDFNLIDRHYKKRISKKKIGEFLKDWRCHCRSPIF